MSARTRAASCAIMEDAAAEAAGPGSCGACADGAAPMAPAPEPGRLKSVQTSGAARSACMASTAPQIASQKGKWPCVAYMTTEVMTKPEKCPAMPRSSQVKCIAGRPS